MKIVSFSLENGNQYFGKIDGQRFYIGSRVSYEGNKGLMNLKGTAVQKYDRNLYRNTYGFWADFIHPTAIAEGALFPTLNTYDKAHFTFSFLQYAAHVPNGDFVVYFRKLLALPLAKDYFPDLAIVNNRICKMSDHGAIPIESDTSTELLMDYLNPSLKEVEDTEVIQAAKFVHWAQNDKANRDVQIDIGINHFKNKMRTYATQYQLDGVLDTVCFLVADIRHQGRAKTPAIIAALQSPIPIEALLNLGEPKYHERVKTLRAEINRLTTEGTFGVRKYSVERGEFV